MPRRRMLDPTFFEDNYVAKLSRDERLFLLGCIRNADDDGRLKAHPAYLKAEIFMYDDDLELESITNIKDSILKKMEMWPADNMMKLFQYTNIDSEYMFFPNWHAQQNPSHPTPSKLPSPPNELFPNISRETPELLPNISLETPSQSSLGQSSPDKFSIDKTSSAKIDFSDVIDNEKDLTNRLTETLEKYLPHGRPQTMEVVKSLWNQSGMQMSNTVYDLLYDAMKKYPVLVLAKSLVKAVKYSEGKKKPANYIQTILDEQMGKGNG